MHLGRVGGKRQIRRSAAVNERPELGTGRLALNGGEWVIHNCAS